MPRSCFATWMPYDPKEFVFGNIAILGGRRRGNAGTIETLVRGEIREFIDVFIETTSSCARGSSLIANTWEHAALFGVRTQRAAFFFSSDSMKCTWRVTAALHMFCRRKAGRRPVTASDGRGTLGHDAAGIHADQL